MAEFVTYRGFRRAVIAINPDDIVYPKKITISTNYLFVGWKKWVNMNGRECPNEYLPLELGKLMKYNFITKEEHNNIITILRSEDIESAYLAHRIIIALKQKRHGKL